MLSEDKTEPKSEEERVTRDLLHRLDQYEYGLAPEFTLSEDEAKFVTRKILSASRLRFCAYATLTRREMATGVPEDAKTLKNTKMSYAVLKCPMPSSSRKFASGIEKNILMNLTINVAAVKIAVPFRKLCPFCSVF